MISFCFGLIFWSSDSKQYTSKNKNIAELGVPQLISRGMEVEVFTNFFKGGTTRHVRAFLFCNITS